MLFAAGLLGGGINSVSSGGSFFTYPAMLVAGLTPIQAAATTVAALTPGNAAAVPEFWPEVQAQRHRYLRDLPIVIVGAATGIGLLLVTGSAAFESLVPWLILGATVLFAVSPAVSRWAKTSAPSLTGGALGAGMLGCVSIYLTYFGSGVGNIMVAVFSLRGFGDYLEANAAKNVAMTVGTALAAVAYTVAGLVSWSHVVPVLIASTISAAAGARWARLVPIPILRGVIVALGLTVAAAQFTR